MAEFNKGATEAIVSAFPTLVAVPTESSALLLSGDASANDGMIPIPLLARTLLRWRGEAADVTALNALASPRHMDYAFVTAANSYAIYNEDDTSWGLLYTKPDATFTHNASTVDLALVGATGDTIDGATNVTAGVATAQQITDLETVISDFAAHEAAADPHPQYLTQTEADALYEDAGAVATHEAAGDPHPQYLTQAEGDAAYAPISSTNTDLTNTPAATEVTVESSTGNNTSIVGATDSLAGVMTAQQVTDHDELVSNAAIQREKDVTIASAANVDIPVDDVQAYVNVTLFDGDNNLTLTELDTRLNNDFLHREVTLVLNQPASPANTVTVTITGLAFGRQVASQPALGAGGETDYWTIRVNGTGGGGETPVLIGYY